MEYASITLFNVISLFLIDPKFWMVKDVYVLQHQDIVKIIVIG